ncbi:gamma-glutamylcyclotransferase [Paracoccus sp. (in: a-proteobacteria)]|uniref:gamma-glutamylcyclotransferase n=1 Tax=Paracoccus sp. TaxID=267 RepID=UPI00321FC764
MARGPLRLTSELVAQVALPPADALSAPLDPDLIPAVEADYDRIVGNIMTSELASEGLWIFAYGSLIWNPAFDHVDQRTAVAHGWHRSFCLGWDKWFRGTADQPGLMLALDRGGQCEGVAYRLPPESLEENLHKLVRREVHFMPHAFPARRIKLMTTTGAMNGVTFAMDRTSGRYVSGLAMDEIADVLAVAAGRLGSMAEYLLSTVHHLEALGLHDRHLWKLQEMVASRIEATARRAAGQSSELRLDWGV